MKKYILENRLKKILDITKKFKGKKIVLFGSCVEDVKNARDIDIAVSGIKPEKFFTYYGLITKEIDDQVDLVDLDTADEFFAKIILEEGKVIYERKRS